MHPISIIRVAMRWTPIGKRKTGRPKRLSYIRVQGNEGEQLDTGTGSKMVSWRSLVTALCVNQHDEDYVCK